VIEPLDIFWESVAEVCMKTEQKMQKFAKVFQHAQYV
jgi:hypothetical protein